MGFGALAIVLAIGAVHTGRLWHYLVAVGVGIFGAFADRS
jgi:hypothetical protein